MDLTHDQVLDILSDIKSEKMTVDDAIRIVRYLKKYTKPDSGPHYREAT